MAQKLLFCSGANLLHATCCIPQHHSPCSGGSVLWPHGTLSTAQTPCHGYQGSNAELKAPGGHLIPTQPNPTQLLYCQQPAEWFPQSLSETAGGGREVILHMSDSDPQIYFRKPASVSLHLSYSTSVIRIM